MHKRRLKWTANIGLTMIFGAATVFAQPAPAGDPGAADGSVDAKIPFGKGSQLTPQEQMTQAEAYVAKMKQTLEAVKKLAQKARAEKDIIKLNCVNDKLTQIDTHHKLGTQSRDELKIAASRRDDGTRNHEFSKLTIEYQKVIVLEQEAEACIGEDIAYIGATQVETEVDPNITKDDPTTPDPEPVEPVELPPVESPFR
jgi:hypothetical protein